MKKILVAALAFVPAFALAQTVGSVGNLTNIQTFITRIGQLINLALPVIVGLALLGFFWGLAMFVFKSGDAEKQKEARSMMIWSVVALFVMVSVWGLVNFIGSTLGVEGGSAPGIPSVPTQRI